MLTHPLLKLEPDDVVDIESASPEEEKAQSLSEFVCAECIVFVYYTGVACVLCLTALGASTLIDSFDLLLLCLLLCCALLCTVIFPCACGSEGVMNAAIDDEDEDAFSVGDVVFFYTGLMSIVYMFTGMYVLL